MNGGTLHPSRSHQKGPLNSAQETAGCNHSGRRSHGEFDGGLQPHGLAAGPFVIKGLPG